MMDVGKCFFPFFALLLKKFADTFADGAVAFTRIIVGRFFIKVAGLALLHMDINMTLAMF